MARTNIYAPVDEYAHPDDRPELLGWYDPDKAAAVIYEDTEWDGNNMVSVVSGDKYAHETLYRTKAGRWVLHRWSQWQGVMPTDRFLEPAEARDWLLRNGSDDEIEQHFGEAPAEESGPAQIGRPEIGGRVTTALGERLLQDVDAYAASVGLTRAQAIRTLLADAIDQALVDKADAS